MDKKKTVIWIEHKTEYELRIRFPKRNEIV